MLFFPTIFVVGSTTNPRCSPGWVCFNMVLVLAGTYLLTWAHEAAHAFAALVMGMRLGRVRIGLGRVWLRGRVGQTDLEVGEFPAGGWTFAWPTSTALWRTRAWLMVAAAPSLHIALWWSFSSSGLTDEQWLWRLLGGTEGPAPLEALAWANGLLMLVNLVPWRLRQPVALRSDGYQLLTIPRLSRDLGASVEGDACAWEAVLWAGRSDRRRAREWCERGLERWPQSIALRVVQAALDVEGGRLEEAKTRLLPLSNDTTDSATRSALGGLLAWCELFISDAALNDADMRSQQALSIEGSHIAYGARGAVLAKLGRAGEAVEHLRISLEHAPNDEWEAHFTAWLALAEARLGRQAEANRLLGIASDLDPRCYSLPRVRAELCHEREVEDA